MTRPDRIERALREVVDFIRAHKLEQEPGLNYRARTVKIGEARLENWAGALGGAPIVGPGGTVYPVNDDAIRKLADSIHDADGVPCPGCCGDPLHIRSCTTCRGLGWVQPKPAHEELFPFIIKHHTGCGRAALRSRKMFLEGSSVELGDLCHLDGGRVAAPMPPSTAVTHGLFGAKCGSCGGTVEVPDLLAFARENERASKSAHRSELHERGRTRAAPSIDEYPANNRASTRRVIMDELCRSCGGDSVVLWRPGLKFAPVSDRWNSTYGLCAACDGKGYTTRTMHEIDQ